MKIKPLLLRVKNSSGIELFYRFNEVLFLKKLKKNIQTDHFSLNTPDFENYNIKNIKLPDFDYNINEKHIGSILNGFRYSLNFDQKRKKAFEKQNRYVFYSDINIPDDIDIRCVWEPARLQHLTQLIIGSESKQNKKTVCFVKKEIFTWIDKNPFLYGPHYISVMECGLRIPVFIYALKIIDSFSDDEKKLILRTIYEHAWFISKRLSLYSSLGNHTICECVGLIFAGVLFNQEPESKKWLQTSLGLLQEESNHQILDDGGPAEQSLNYHCFVLDLYQLSINFLKKNGFADCLEMKDRITSGENFIKYFKDSFGSIPNIGDNDEGYAIAPEIFPKRTFGKKNAQDINTFHNSGYTLIRNEICCFCFDHGPLGMAPLYNHGHSDALSILLSVYGKPFLIDPGTYRYNGVPEWRRYFKSTRAHNTVVIDNMDQAAQETGFIWSKPYNSNVIEILEKNNEISITASHNGYKRLKNSITHYRKIHSDDALNFQITDSFEGSGSHEFELNYHFHPDVTLTNNGDCWTAVNDDVEIKIFLLDEMVFTLYRGETNPAFGWFSKTYGQKEATSVLSCKVKKQPKEMIFKTEISINKKNGH